jgi:hypothetical protein
MAEAVVVGIRSAKDSMTHLVAFLISVRERVASRPRLLRSVLIVFSVTLLLAFLDHWVPLADLKLSLSAVGLTGFRAQLLEEVERGYRLFHVPLVLISKAGGAPHPVESQGDDLGLYFWIPLVARFFSTTVGEVNLIFCTLSIVSALFISAAGFFVLLRPWLLRVLAAFALVWIAHKLWGVPDQLATGACISLAVIPWILVFYRRTSTKAFASFLFFLGILLKFSQTIRSNSATPVILFLFMLILLDGMHRWKSGKTKFKLIGCFLAGYAIFTAGFSLAIANRSAVLEKHGQSLAPYSSGHPFWHTAYLSLGYVSNDHDIVVNDGYSYAAVDRYRHGVPAFSNESEGILRLLWWRLLIKDPKFIFTNIYRKSKVVLAEFIYPFLLAWVASFLLLRRRRLDLAFLGGLSVASVTGIIATPEYYYMTGVYGFTIAYLLVLLNDLVDPKVEFLA